MENFDNFFFDFDGTLMNTSEGVFKAFDTVVEHYGIEIQDKSVYNTMIGPPLYESFTRVFHFKKEDIPAAIEVYRSYYTPKGIWECHLYDGVVPLIEKLRKAGKKIFVATSKPELYAKQLLQRHNIDHLFDFVGGCDMEETRANKLDVINYVLDSNNLRDKLDSCLMIGDTHYDINGAKAAGLKSMGILWGFGNRETLDGAGADFICETPADVEKLLLG